MLFADKYSEIEPRFINWLEVSNTGNALIPNIALDYLNRAQSSLSDEAPNGWVYLTKDYVPLTLGGTTGLEVTFPTDCGRLLCVYTDPNGDNKPDIYYYKDGKIQSGFRLIPTYAKATGWTLGAKFFYAPIGPPYCRYQIILPDFAGTATEYSAFPGNLLLLEAQRIRCREQGLTKEWQILKVDYESELLKFKEKYQNTSEEIDITLNDANGLPISIPEYNVFSGTRNRQMYGQRNDRDGYRY